MHLLKKLDREMESRKGDKSGLTTTTTQHPYARVATAKELKAAWKDLIDFYFTYKYRI